MPFFTKCLFTALFAKVIARYNSRPIKSSISRIILLACLLGSSAAFAQGNFYSIASGDWGNAGTWTLNSGTDVDGIPDGDDNVVVRGGFTVNMEASHSCASITVGGTATGAPFNNFGILTFGGSFSLTVNGFLTVGGANNAARDGSLTFASGSSITATSLTFGQAGGGDNNSIDMTAGGTLTVGSITVNTTGITNTWTPGTGTLVLNNTNTLPAADVISFNNLIINNGTTTLGTGITIGGLLSVTNPGALSISTFTLNANGGISITGSTISGSGSLTLGSDVTVVASAATCLISAPIAVGGADRTFNVNDDVATIPDLSITGAITGASGIIKSGAGSLNIGSTGNAYLGTTIVSQGTLRLAVAGAIPNTSAVTVNANLDMNSFNEVIGSLTGTGTVLTGSGTPILTTGGDNTSTTFSGTIQNALRIIKQGTGEFTLSGNNTYTNGTSVNLGTLRINSATAIGTGTLTMNGGNLDSGSGITLSTNNAQAWNSNFTFVGSNNLNLGTGAVTLSANRQVTVSGNTLTVGGAISGAFSLTKSGSGALSLAGANTFSGGITLDDGQLNINSANALGNATNTFTINGGVIDNTSGGVVTTANYPLTWANDFTFLGSNNLNLGTGVISMPANRQVTVNSGTLIVGGTLSASALTLSKNGAGNLAFGSNAVTLNSLAINAGTFTSTSGLLTISGNFSNIGTFAHNAGTVAFNGISPQSVAGAIFNNVNFTGVGQKNAIGNIASVGNLTNTSTLDMGLNTLTVTAITNTGGTIRFSGPSNGIAVNSGTVEYYGASQTVAAGSYDLLNINQSSGFASLSGDIAMTGTLTLTNGSLNLAGNDCTLGTTFPWLSGSFSASRMIIATGGGNLIKPFPGGGTTTFPIGDNSGALEYSPITIGVPTATTISVSVTDGKHPNNASSTHYLTRYWDVTSTNAVFS